MIYNVGDIIEGKVTGIKPYGVFVEFDDKMTGLLHISEISDSFVKKISNIVNVNEIIKVKIIDVDVKNKQYKLSIKALDVRRSRSNYYQKSNNKNGEMPLLKIGFETIETNLNRWIEEGLVNVKD